MAIDVFVYRGGVAPSRGAALEATERIDGSLRAVVKGAGEGARIQAADAAGRLVTWRSSGDAAQDRRALAAAGIDPSALRGAFTQDRYSVTAATRYAAPRPGAQPTPAPRLNDNTKDEAPSQRAPSADDAGGDEDAAEGDEDEDAAALDRLIDSDEDAGDASDDEDDEGEGDGGDGWGWDPLGGDEDEDEDGIDPDRSPYLYRDGIEASRDYEGGSALHSPIRGDVATVIGKWLDPGGPDRPRGPVDLNPRIQINLPDGKVFAVLGSVAAEGAGARTAAAVTAWLGFELDELGYDLDDCTCDIEDYFGYEEGAA